MDEVKKLLLCLLVLVSFATATAAGESLLQVKEIVFGSEGTRISIQYAAPETSSPILVQITYPGVPRPFTPERDYCQNRDGNTVGFNMKPAVGVNEIYLITKRASELRILPRVNNTLQQLLKDQGVETIADALYLKEIANDLIRVTYEPYGYENAKPSKTYTLKLRSDSTFEVSR